MQTQTFQQFVGEPAFDDSAVLHVALQGGESIAMFKAGMQRPPRLDWKVEVDLRNKAGQSVLAAPLVLDSQMHAFDLKAAAVETPTLTVGDVLSVYVNVIEGMPGEGHPGNGLFAAALIAG